VRISSAGWKTQEDVAAHPGAAPGQHLGHGEQDGGVPVVAAGVHHPGVGRGVRGTGGLVDRQSVDIGAQQDRGSGLGSADQRGDAGSPNALAHRRDAGDRSQAGGDQRGGSRLLKAQLGVPVQVAAGLHQLFLERRHLRRG